MDSALIPPLAHLKSQLAEPYARACIQPCEAGYPRAGEAPRVLLDVFPTDERRRKFRFGPFEVDAETGELRKDGRRVRLQEKSFQVLLALLEQRGMLVNREGLRDRLWAADTFVDFDNGLNTAVSKLRDALGDSAETPRFIETLARRGYRFIGQVEELGEPPAAPSRLQVAIRRLEPDIVVAEFAGRIVLGPECQQIERLVSDLVRSKEMKVVFDLSGVCRMDSTGVGIIVVCSGELKRAGGELCVAGAKGIVEQILRMTRVDTIVSLHPTAEAAAKAFRAAPERGN